jgi:hypothetical protein
MYHFTMSVHIQYLCAIILWVHKILLIRDERNMLKTVCSCFYCLFVWLIYNTVYSTVEYAYILSFFMYRQLNTVNIYAMHIVVDFSWNVFLHFNVAKSLFHKNIFWKGSKNSFPHCNPPPPLTPHSPPMGQMSHILYCLKHNDIRAGGRGIVGAVLLGKGLETKSAVGKQTLHTLRRGSGEIWLYEHTLWQNLIVF